MNDSRIQIIICVEQGVLEEQAKLFIKAVSNLKKSEYLIHAYSPREQKLPSNETVAFFKQHNVVWINEALNQNFYQYPIANKLLASLHFEVHQSQPASIVFSDTDTVILNDLYDNVDLNKPALFLRPVDNKGPGSEGKDDLNDKFWKGIFTLCGIEMPAPSVWTTVRPHLIRNYFNAGFIWAHNLDGFFKQWYEDFIKIVNSDLRPFGWISRDGDDFRCLDQVALAVTATRFQEYLQVLPETYNYPIPFRPLMKNRTNHPSFNDLVHVHYHKWFQHPKFLEHVISAEECESNQYQWLKSHLPLKPEIDGKLKC